MLSEIDFLSTVEAGPAAVRGGALRVGSFMAGSLVSVGVAALLFRYLGVVNTGLYTTALSLSAVVTGFTDLGLTAIGMREFSVQRGEERATLARNLLGIRLVLTVIGVILISVFAFLAYGRTLGLGVLIAGAGVLVQNTQTTLAVPLMAELRLGWVAALDLARQMVSCSPDSRVGAGRCGAVAVLRRYRSGGGGRAASDRRAGTGADPAQRRPLTPPSGGLWWVRW